MAEKRFFKTFSNALDELKENNLLSKRNIIFALILGIIILALPIGVTLVQQQQTIKSRASCNTDPLPIFCEGTEAKQCTPYLNEESGECVADQCPVVGRCENGVPITSGGGPSPTQAPGGLCDIAGKQSPSAGDQCTACIVSNNGGLIDSIKGVCPASSPGKSNTELINFWCNEGVQGGQADCNVKKSACGSVCGTTSSVPACDVNQANLTISPATLKVGDEVIFAVSGSQGSTHTSEDFSDPSFVQFLRDDFSSGFKKVFKILKLGTFTWTHKWQNTAPDDLNNKGPVCSKLLSVTINAQTDIVAPGNLTAQCNAAGNQATLSWTSNSSKFDLRVDGPATYPTQANNCSPHNVCINGFASRTITVNTTPASSLKFWVHAESGSGQQGPISETKTFTCTAPTSTTPPTGTTTPTATATPADAFGAKCIATNNDYFTQWLTYIQVGRVDRNSNIDKDYDCDNNDVLEIVDYNIWRNRKFNLAL